MPVRAARPAVGVGLRSPHVEEVLARRPKIGWFEVHAENYMHDPVALALLERVRADWPISLHGVSLSLGSAEPLSRQHLADLKALIARIDPFLVSEHMSWSAIGGVHLNDLLPLPLDDESLELLSGHIDEVQHTLGRKILIENPSGYLRLRHSTMDEAEFLAELATRSGCTILCDVNNLLVTAHNVGLDAAKYLASLPKDVVEEIHLAGHSSCDVGRSTILIDDHGSRVTGAVWNIYRQALRRFGDVPTLIEWDNALPTLDVLIGEARKAETLLAREQHEAAA